MKTINFFAALVAAFVINVNASANNNANTASVKMDQPQSNVYKYNNVGDKKYKTVYATDEMGRVTSKQIFIQGEDSWVPVGAYSVFYGEEENIVTYAGWNSVSGTFTKNATQQHFDANEFPVVITMPSK